MNPTFENIELFPGQIVATVSHIDCTNICYININAVSPASQSSQGHPMFKVKLHPLNLI